jgi:PPIC-type PPIASE domain
MMGNAQGPEIPAAACNLKNRSTRINSILIFLCSGPGASDATSDTNLFKNMGNRCGVRGFGVGIARLRGGFIACFLISALSNCEASKQLVPPNSADLAAIWDGGVITRRDLAAEIQKLNPTLRVPFDTETGRQEFIQAVLAKRLLFDEAKRRGIDQSDALRAQVQELEQRLSIQELLLQEARTLPRPTEAELRAYFEAHRASFAQALRVHVVRLLAGPKKTNAKGRVAQWRAQLLKGVSIETLAPESDGPEAVLKGDIGWFSNENNPLALAALKLKQHEVSSSLETAEGVAVLKCVERIEAQQPTFETVKAEVEGQYEPVRQRLIFDSLVKKLKKDSQAQIVEPARKEVRP